MWKNVSFKIPEPAKEVKQGLTPVLTAVSPEMGAAESRLAGVAGFIPVTPSSVSGNAGNAKAMMLQIRELLDVSAQLVCIHPYVHPVGNRIGDYSYLSPGQCHSAMLNKMKDSYETFPDGDLCAVFLDFSATEHAELAEMLKAFNLIFPVTRLQMIQRRAESLAVLETEKFTLGSGFISPKFQETDSRQHRTNRMIDMKLARLAAVSHGYDTQNKRPETLLSELIAKKKKATETANTDWETYTALLSGGKGRAAALNGSIDDICRGYEGLPVSSGNKGFTVCCSWIGKTEVMTVFKEVLGI